MLIIRQEAHQPISTSHLYKYYIYCMKPAYGVHVVKQAAVVMALRNFRSVHRSFEPSSHSHLLLSQGLVSAQDWPSSVARLSDWPSPLNDAES